MYVVRHDDEVADVAGMAVDGEEFFATEGDASGLFQMAGPDAGIEVVWHLGVEVFVVEMLVARG